MMPAFLRATLLLLPVLPLLVSCKKKSSDDAPLPPPPQIAISMVSVASDGVTAANATCGDPAMSADGNIIAFTSTANNLAGATGGNACIFIKNMSTGVLTMLLGDTGAAPNNDCASLSISNDGRYIAFDSGATNLDNGTTIPGPFSNIYVHDRNTGNNTLISHQAVATTGGNQNSTRPTISAAGGFVVFQSVATDLTAITTANMVYRATIAGAGLTTVSRDGATGLLAANAACTEADISSTGQFISYRSQATNIDAAATNGLDQIFACDFTKLGTANSSILVSRNDGLGAQGNGGSTSARISDDGVYVVFMSQADNMGLDADAATPHDIFMRNWQAGAAAVDTKISQHSSIHDPAHSGNTCDHPEISATGQYVVWHSFSAVMVDDDTGGFMDYFRHDSGSGATIRVSLTAAGAQQTANGTGVRPAMTPDGLFCAFGSFATNLVGAPASGGIGQIYRKGSY